MNEPTPMYFDDEIDLREVLTTLLHGWKVIVALVLLGGIAAFGFSSSQTPIYEACAVIAIPPGVSPVNPTGYLVSDEMRQMIGSVEWEMAA
ncbi:hypothetical protein D6833_01190 [Candidatus Parcubacteria bacterium]|nr:MAG: hypothetical protein D6833_01190 [Candidatus Parcubacteria bacterium]